MRLADAGYSETDPDFVPKPFAMKKWMLLLVAGFVFCMATAQQKNTSNNPEKSQTGVTRAELGSFPYFRTLPNFQKRGSNDSVTVELNQVYFFDGKKYFAIEGKVSSQVLDMIDRDQKKTSEFQVIQEFDKIIATLGGKKIYTGELPTNLLKPIAGTDDIIALYRTHQVVNSAHYGVVEYMIKTPEKELWVQLQPYSIASGFYTLLVVEKQETLVSLNTNKPNQLLTNLEKNGKTTVAFQFVTDSATIESQSKDELLSILGILQSHPDWKLKIDVHMPSLGKAVYTQTLTQQRADEIKKQLVSLGAKAASIDAKGWGDTKPVINNETEKNRMANYRVEISRF